MESQNVNRRHFLQAATTVAATGAIAGGVQGSPLILTAAADKPAVLGGTPVRSKDKGWPSWPQKGAPDEKNIMQALNDKAWCYTRKGGHFCQEYSKRMSAEYGATAFLTNSGTCALHTGLFAVEVGPGDEVLVPGDSFIATVQSILNCFALPVFVDLDPTTGLIDPALLERAITPNTKAILPVHLFGASCDMDAIMAVANKHNLKVIEDACQSPYVEWGGKKLGTIGDCGAISFNVWKTLGCGEGGLIVSSKPDVARACGAFLSNGRDPMPESGSNPGFMGMNYRPTEFQGALLMTQTDQYLRQAPVRRKNAAYLTKGFTGIPGIEPLRVFPKMTNHNYYNYMLRYDADAMAGLPIEKFTRAMAAEGIACGSKPDSGIMTGDTGVSRMLQSAHFRKIYSADQLKRAEASRDCPKALHLSRTMIQVGQFVLLASQADMDDILTAARKIQQNAGALAKA